MDLRAVRATHATLLVALLLEISLPHKSTLPRELLVLTSSLCFRMIQKHSLKKLHIGDRYFVLMDIVVLFQYMYYNALSSRRRYAMQRYNACERTRNMHTDTSHDYLPLPASREEPLLAEGHDCCPDSEVKGGNETIITVRKLLFTFLPSLIERELHGHLDRWLLCDGTRSFP